MNYSIITPTRNEGKYIEETLKSVVTQTIPPSEWLIMDDDSTDETFELIHKYSAIYPFIKYYNLSDFRPELRNRGGRVAAIINYADTLRKIQTDVIAKIDGDIKFGPDFFENILGEFQKDPKFGVASGHMVENGIPEKITERNSGRGASLIIRYDCFLQIGKFYESKTRGEDDLAYVAARAKGWRTETLDFYFDHLKPIGARNSKLKNHYETGFYKGSVQYFLPFFLMTCLRDVFKTPFLIGALAIICGYIHARLILKYKPFPDFVSQHIRMEQKHRLKKAIGF